MEMTANVELTKEKNLMELLDLLRKNNMQEAANNIFEMAAYVDVMGQRCQTSFIRWKSVRQRKD